MWDLPRPGVKPVSLALQGGFLATGPQGSLGKLLFEGLGLPGEIPLSDETVFGHQIIS